MKIMLRKNLKIPKQSQLIKFGKENVTPKFKKWVKEFMDEHNDTLRELAKR